MLIPYKEIQRRIQARIQNTGTSTDNANDLLPKIKDWCNERYDRIYKIFPWSGTIDTYNLTLTADQSEYAFDRNVYKVWGILDKTNGRVVKEDDLQQHLRFHAVDLEQTGNILQDDPLRWRRVGKKTVKARVGDTGEKITVVSSSANDISPHCVRIIGEVNGVKIGENVTLTGTSSAESTNTYDANQILTVNIGTTDGTRKDMTGKVTITGSTSSTVFAEISPQEFAREYLWFRTSAVPKSTGTQPTWEIWHSTPLEFLVNDNDIPVIDCCDEIVQGVFADALREDGLETEADRAESKWIGMIIDLTKSEKSPAEVEQFIPKSPDFIRTMDFGRMIGGSQ